MRITFRSRIRAFLLKHGPATIDQVVAAVGKHVTAAQAMRAWERTAKTMKLKYSSKTKIETGRRRHITDALNTMKNEGFVIRVRPATFKLAS